MREIFCGGWSSVVNLAWILGAGAQVTLRVAMVLTFMGGD